MDMTAIPIVFHGRRTAGVRDVPGALCRLRLAARFLAGWTLALALAVPVLACSGDDSGAGRAADDVDPDQPAAVTERERQAFSEPAAGVLAAEQVEKYLKTSLLQFDLLHQHAESLHEGARRIGERAERRGAAGGLMALVEGGRWAAQAVDVIGGSYVRSARTLGYNPAEMEWVRDRMAEAATHVAALAYQESSRQVVAQVREQARELEAMRAAGDFAIFSEADIQQMFAGAEEMEREIESRVDPTAARNVEVLRAARPNVTDAMWLQVGWHGGGLMSWAGFVDPQDELARRQHARFRQVFEDALANRATPLDADYD
jgi:hypothetical protein